MRNLHIIDLLKSIGINEQFYWGKRIVKSLPQPGSFKNHAVVANWIEREKIRLELRAGLSGKTLSAKELANYPLQFQSETFFELHVEDQSEKEDSKGKTGKGGKGSVSHAFKRRDPDALRNSFWDARSEKIATCAKLSRGVVMGMEIGRDALERVFDQFCEQVRHARVLATDLLASAGKAITRFTPPPFMAPRGDEDKVYKYDREKNETMFGVAPG
jgi:hypothetical protein